MKILELFAGIGACSTALKRIGVDLEIIDAVEIDKYAIASFNAIHGTNFETQDITTYDKDLKDIDIITHGSPCQDFSVAGKQAGGDLGSGTRSSLMYETIRIVGKIRPKYVLWENVKNLLSAKHKHNFDAYIETMNVLGYNSYYQVLNAKDYEIPQNRERVYTISIRKDIDNGSFKFPEKEELKLRLKDMLENEVDEKYYLDGVKTKQLITHSSYVNKKYEEFINEKGYVPEMFNPYNKSEIKDIAPTQTEQCGSITTSASVLKCVRIGGIFDTEKSTHQAGSIYDKEGLSPTLDVMQGGWRQPSIIIKNATKKGYDEATDGDSVNLQYPDSNTRRGRVGHQVSQTIQCNDSMGVVEGINKNAKHQQDLVQHSEGICKVIPAGTHGSTPHLLKTIVNENPLRIRKLTPKECWRLMGFSDEDFEKAANVPTSNTQLYKQARKFNRSKCIRKNI